MLTVQESTIGIPELAEDAFGQVYPNPASERISISMPLNSDVSVYDNTGRKILETSTNNETMVMDVSNLEQGIYFLHIYFDGQTVSRTFLKK
jgi:hypothetical protein